MACSPSSAMLSMSDAKSIAVDRAVVCFVHFMTFLLPLVLAVEAKTHRALLRPRATRRGCDGAGSGNSTEHTTIVEVRASPNHREEQLPRRQLRAPCTLSPSTSRGRSPWVGAE